MAFHFRPGWSVDCDLSAAPNPLEMARTAGKLANKPQVSKSIAMSLPHLSRRLSQWKSDLVDGSCSKMHGHVATSSCLGTDFLLIEQGWVQALLIESLIEGSNCPFRGFESRRMHDKRMENVSLSSSV